MPLESGADVFREFIEVKYRTVLKDAFAQVFNSYMTLAVQNLSGKGLDEYMLISPENTYRMLLTLHQHSNSETNIRCKANTRKTLLECDHYFLYDKPETPLQSCTVPYVLQALETMHRNHLPVSQALQDKVMALSTRHHLGLQR